MKSSKNQINSTGSIVAEFMVKEQCYINETLPLSWDRIVDSAST